MRLVKVTSKGQVTIPVEIRTELGIDERSYLQVVRRGDEIRLRKAVAGAALDEDDPIWELIGAGESGLEDVARQHDRHLAATEVERWRGSS